MYLTPHAKRRMKQRGIDSTMLEVIEKYGIDGTAPKARSLTLTNKHTSKLLEDIEKMHKECDVYKAEIRLLKKEKKSRLARNNSSI